MSDRQLFSKIVELNNKIEHLEEKISYLKNIEVFSREKIEYLESNLNIKRGSFEEVSEYREFLRKKRPVFKFNIN